LGRFVVFEDILRRALEFYGYKVQQAMNLTDVDDKTIKGAISTNQSLDDFTKPFKKSLYNPWIFLSSFISNG
jgi:cysteinyl-tRNA synthetase